MGERARALRTMSDSGQAPDPKIGVLLQGRYRIVRKLGEGGMGAVYEAQHELIGRRVAIKTLQPYFAQNAEITTRFHREANAATAIGNEHIIEVTDFGSFEDGSPYIVMEFLEGVEFGQLLEREGSLPVARVVHILTQVCSALGAAHARGIVHRDMKPENIYLILRSHDPDFVKVLDFGISKVLAAEEDLAAGGLTKTGMALGTPYYMPPEQAQGVRDVDHRVDVYALGVILYRALAGRLPFEADTYPALILKVMSETPIALRRLRGDVPQALEQIVQKAMERDRAQRFQSVEELAFALQPFAGLDLAPHMLASLRPRPGLATPMQAATPFAASNLPSHPPPGGALTSAPPPPGKSAAKRAVVAGVLLAALGGGGMAWVASRSSEPKPLQPAPPTVARAAPVTAPAPPAEPPARVPAPAPVAVAQPVAVQAAPAEVRLRISAKPPSARVFIAGVEFPNPTDAFRPRSLDPVRIRVEASGHQAVEQLAIFDQDRVLDFALERGTGTRQLGQPGQAKARPEPAAAARDQPEPAEPIKAAAPAAPGETGSEGLYRGPTGAIRDEF